MPAQPTVQPVDMARFLRDTVDAVTAKQLTIADQTGGGWVRWADERDSTIPAIRWPFVEKPTQTSDSLLTVERPPARRHPVGLRSADPEVAEAQRRHDEHEKLYNELFEAKQPSPTLELVVAIGLLSGDHLKGPIERHLLVAPAEVTLSTSTGALSVRLTDSFSVELNWLPADIRELVAGASTELEDAADSVTLAEFTESLGRTVAHLGTTATLRPDRWAGRHHDSLSLSASPAVLLRKRDTSGLLRLLKDMTDDLEAGGHSTEAFKMLLDTSYEPEPTHESAERPALALPANTEQRALIERAQMTPHMVIQGPPGTGKTHTIANLASILMAQGKRVLITAENDQAVSEVQNKLPDEMQALLLPMFKGKDSSRLAASVNELLSRAAENTNDGQLRRREKTLETTLDALEMKLASLQSELRNLAQSDQQEVEIGDRRMPLAGHLQYLAGESDRLLLAHRLLNENGYATDTDARCVLERRPNVPQADFELAELRLPDGLPDPVEVASALDAYSQELGVLGEVGRYDYADLLIDAVDLEKLHGALLQLPVLPWNEFVEQPASYATAAADSEKAASQLNHGIAITGGSVEAAIAVLERWLLLDPVRWPQPPLALTSLFDSLAADKNTRSGATLNHGTDPVGLAETCRRALRALEEDTTGLVEPYVVERLGGIGSVQKIVAEATDLVGQTRFPIGAPVSIGANVPLARMRRQAENLRAHLAGGGKFTGLLGSPKAVREAQDLLDGVLVGGCEIQTLEEVERALVVLAHKVALEEVEVWAEANGLKRPSSVTIEDWLNQLAQVPGEAQAVEAAIHAIDVGISWSTRTPSSLPVRLRDAVQIATSTVTAELGPFIDAYRCFGAEVRIAGKPVATRDDAETALPALRAQAARLAAAGLLPARWREVIDPLDADSGDRLVDALKAADTAAQFPAAARKSELSASSIQQVATDVARDSRRRDTLAGKKEFLDSLRHKLAGCVPQSDATRLIEMSLTDENPRQYREGTQALADERERANRAADLVAAIRRLRAAHPRLMAALETDDRDATDALEQLEDLQALMAHRAEVDRRLAETTSSAEIFRELAVTHDEYRQREAQLASVRCWSKAVDRVNSERGLSSALSALSVAVDKVPKTRTAKSYAPRMRTLRQATLRAAPAIPCWVMAIDRLAETLGYIQAEDRFDTVIVDEASQAWTSSLFLYNVAHQVIVVGDDLQTSPAARLMNEQDLRAIAQQHISDHPIANSVGPDLSLYDIASTMTAPEAMVDHFRCVPDIIDISNRLCYEPKGKRLRPARLRQPDALEPVVLQPVAGMRRSASAANDQEISAIVEAVLDCHNDSRYNGLTFGCVVVGPQPTGHLKQLRGKLLEHLGAIASSERRLEVGTPAQFQGAERDVMFLSLVESSKSDDRIRCWPLEYTGRNRSRVQQLNVAASRARDQLWIFHSFAVSDLDPFDARRVLLEPGAQPTYDLDEQLAKCDSNFERDVVRAINQLDRRIRIQTQVPALGYLIDVVVEDFRSGNRLAVECDGDQWHTDPDDVRRDLYRQRTLESVGWEFHRFLSSEWYADPDTHARDIVERLTRTPVGGGVIEPGVAPSVGSTIVAPVETESVVPELIGEPLPARKRRSEDPKEPELIGIPTWNHAPKRDTNRELAELLRQRGVEPAGEAWLAAKELLAAGATIGDAASHVAATHRGS